MNNNSNEINEYQAVIDKTFEKIFDYRTPRTLFSAAELKKNLAKCNISANSTNLSFYDIDVHFVSKTGEKTIVCADVLEVCIEGCKGKYDNFETNIQPKIDYRIHLTFSSEGVVSERIYPLKSFDYSNRAMQQGSIQLYFLDANDKTNSVDLFFKNSYDLLKLDSFMSVILKDNVFASEKTLRSTMEDPIAKKAIIEDCFNRAFSNRIAVSWDKESNNRIRAEKYGIFEKNTFISFTDLNMQYIDDLGNLCDLQVDSLKVSVFHKKEKLESFNCSLHPRIDYSVELFCASDGKEYKRKYNLKYLDFKQGQYNILTTIFVDTQNLGQSVKVIFNREIDAQYLYVFMYIVLVNNIYDVETKERENRINAPINAPVSNNINPTINLFGGVNKFFGINTSSMPVKTVQGKTASGNVDPYQELESLIGLKSIKEDIKQLASFMRIQQQRKQNGLPKVPVSLHLVFTGNPGTGKTTIARILAKIYKDIGVLSTGQMIEVDRASLVAEYIGQTAVKTQNKIKEAIGGILFIDEAYTLAKGDSKDFGQEAIDTILKAMEDNRENFIVIVAGYPDLMKNFIESNPGLQSRFNKYINFPDYNEAEMIEIFSEMCDKYTYSLDDEAREKLTEIVHDIYISRDSNFANARTVRNLFEKVITKQASRLASTEINKEDMLIIKQEDFA